MMKTSTIMTLPPKMAQQFADRAKRMDGCVRRGHIWEFAQGNMVVCLIGLDPPFGHQGKDVERAQQISAELATLNGGVK